jgi:histidyl-tRNA synthetase
MAKDVNPPRGNRDFLPLEKQKRDAVLGVIRSTYMEHGFQEIETPAMEDIDRLTSGQGGDNEKLAFRVMKRGAELESALTARAEGNEDSLADLGLRYDLTVPLTRFYATNRSKLPNIFKAIQTGPVWRAERPQKGRYRQFVQCDIDIIGDATELAEVELLNASLDALAAVGLETATIRVNHRELLTANIAALGVSADQAGSAMITIDKLDKLGVEGVAAELESKFGAEVAAKASAWLESIGGALDVPTELKFVFDAVGGLHPGKLRFDPTLVRGMGYYTGFIFEIEHPGSGSSIGGGGRYDGMVGRWLGTDVPAVGISIGFERAVDLVSDEFLAGLGLGAGAAGGLVLVVDDSAEALANALRIQRELIAGGEKAVRIERRPKKINLLLESLGAQGFGRFAFVGVETGSVADLQIKDIAG